jgi:hypothetical protein
MRLRFLAHEADFSGFPGGWLAISAIVSNSKNVLPIL